MMDFIGAFWSSDKRVQRERPVVPGDRAPLLCRIPERFEPARMFEEAAAMPRMDVHEPQTWGFPWSRHGLKFDIYITFWFCPHQSTLFYYTEILPLRER